MSSPILSRVALANGCRVVVNSGHDKLATEASSIGGITLSINEGKSRS